MAKIKKIKTIGKMIGTIPLTYKRDVTYDTIVLLNAHSDAVNYLYSVIVDMNKEIEQLKTEVAELKGYENMK